jgi:hypothetical protein
VDIQWISKINHLELKLMFYNMLKITCLLRLLNLFKIDSWKYLLFVATYLYMRIWVYLSAGFGCPFGFWVFVRVLGIRGFGFGDGFPPELVFNSGISFDNRFWFWVHEDSTWSEPDPLPSLSTIGCVQYDFWAYGTFGANHAPILHRH